MALPIKIRIYLARPVRPTDETCTLTSADAKSLEAFHMKCQRRILKVSWRQFVRNSEISALTGLPAINVIASPSLVTLPDCRTTPQHIKHYSLTSTSHSWSRRRGRPRSRWIDQIRNTCRPLETGPWTRSSWSTAHAGYAMMMM